jgi:hemolysin type calcium-binding protein
MAQPAARILFAVAAMLALAPAASAALARDQSMTALDRSSDARSCVGPCPVVVYFKGNGSGAVTTTPGAVVCTTTCAIGADDLPATTDTVTLRAEPRPGSELKRWENCPAPQNADCRLDFDLVGAKTVCAVFVTAGSTALESACPPPLTPLPPVPPAPPPPPPPPTGPPTLGAACTITGSSRADVMFGTAGRDVICGRGGNDVINGRGGHDLVLGARGADRLTGGSGRDAIYGGAGNDTLSARDGVRDTVHGGLGRDRARWDAADIRRSIERRL